MQLVSGRTAQLVTGRILQFDHVRGYGFVGADDDGEDVFLHASVFDGDPDKLAPGTKVGFKVMAGDRGRKAFAAHLIDDGAEEGHASPPRLIPSPRPVPTSAPVPAQASIAPAPQAPDMRQETDDEQMCDVLSPAEFGQELAELLLSNVPSLTGQQVLEVRKSMLECASKHGWVDI